MRTVLLAMDANDIVTWAAIAVLAGGFAGAIWHGRRQARLLKTASELISLEAQRKRLHLQELERLTNQEEIIADMERGADIMEARTANRLTKPRPDAGPPAKIHRPKAMRRKVSGWWNPPSDYNAKLGAEKPVD